MRSPSSRALLAGALVLAAACGPAPATPTTPATPAGPTAGAEPTAAPRPPAAITAGAMPGDAQAYVELTGARALLKAAGSALGEPVMRELRASVVREMQVPEATAERLLQSIESVHLGGRRTGEGFKVAVSVVYSDAQPVREVLSGPALVDQGPFGAHGRRYKERKGKDIVIWFEGPRLLVIGDEPMLEAVAAVVEGRAPGLTDAQRGAGAAAGDKPRASAFVAPSLLDMASEGGVSFPEPLSIVYDLWEGGIRGAYRATVALHGKDEGARPAPAPLPASPRRPLSIARLLPAETASYVALSTGIPGGTKGAAQLLSATVAGGGPALAGGVRQAEAFLGEVGVSLAQVLGSLGGEGVLAVALRPGVKSQKDLESGFAVLWVQEIADAKPAEALLELVRKKLAGVPRKAKVRAEPGGFSVDLLGAPIPLARARLARGKLFVGVGQRDLVDHALLALDKGKGTLGDDAAHTRTLGALPGSSQLRLWIDFARAAELAAAVAPPGQRGALELWRGAARGPKGLNSALSFSAAVEGDRIRMELDEVNGVGIFAALGIYGVRRYLASAKTAEARNTVSSIARSAIMAWEREQLGPGPGSSVVHTLCKTAQPVPAAVPHARKYVPSSQPGADWHSGDAATGWQCLKMELDTPHYYQYTYSAGGPYKGPARGGPDPGPNGFEVAAEGDLDGDGTTSLFTIAGTIDPASGSVKLSPMFVDRELD